MIFFSGTVTPKTVAWSDRNSHRHLVMTQQFNSTQLCAIDTDGVPGFYMV
jgi:hypothetical protein